MDESCKRLIIESKVPVKIFKKSDAEKDYDEKQIQLGSPLVQYFGKRDENAKSEEQVRIESLENRVKRLDEICSGMLQLIATNAEQATAITELTKRLTSQDLEQKIVIKVCTCILFALSILGPFLWLLVTKYMT